MPESMTLAPPVQLNDGEAWKLRALQLAAQLAVRDAETANANARAYFQQLAAQHGFDADVAHSLTDDGRLVPTARRPTE